MRGLRFDRLMCGTALALPLTVVLAIPRLSAQANTPTPAAIESAVPMPEGTTMAPPTAADTAPAHTQGIRRQRAGGDAAPAETTGTDAASRHHARQRSNPRPSAPAETAATPPAEAVDPLASLNPADRPIAEKLRDLLPKADRTFASRKERMAVEAFYQKRNYAPVWFERGAVDRAHQGGDHPHPCVERRRPDPGRLHVPGAGRDAPEAQADAELRMTAYADHLHAPPAGRPLPVRPHGRRDPDAANAAGSDGRAHHARGGDRHRRGDRHLQPAATRLSRAQGEARGAARQRPPEEPKVVRIPEGPTLRPGTEDARVPLLRQRLNVAGDATNLRYDEALATAVKAYQKSNQMNPDG